MEAAHCPCLIVILLIACDCVNMMTEAFEAERRAHEAMEHRMRTAPDLTSNLLDQESELHMEEARRGRTRPS